VYHLARSLIERGEEVAVVSYQPDEQSRAAYEAVGVEVRDGAKGEPSDSGRGRIWLAPYPFSPSLRGALADAVGDFDAVVLSGARMLQYTPEILNQKAAIVVDYVDDPALEHARRGNHSTGVRNRVRCWKHRFGRKRYEKHFLKGIKVASFVSDVDCRSFSGRHARVPVHCVPNGVDAAYFGRPPEHDSGGGSDPVIVFTGHMSNPNNERAAIFLVREVGPKLWSKLPEARIQIVGADPTEAVRQLAGRRVEITGEVPDIRPYLWQSSVVVLPMQSGTGIKNKLLEAWAAGTAVVATPLACQGVDAKDGKDLMIAESTSEFASSMVNLTGNRELKKRLASAGRNKVVEHYTWQAMAERLRRIVLACYSTGSVDNVSGRQRER
jgi:glycosyltransferase involved in cell wall biosynthesis